MTMVIGLICAYVRCVCDEKAKRYTLTGGIAGAILALVMTYMKTATDKIDTGIWNLRIYAVSVAALVLFVIFTIISRWEKRVCKTVGLVMLTVYMAVTVIYYLPPFLEYPHTILLTEDSMLSTGFLVDMVGVTAGFVLALVTGIAAGRGAAQLGHVKAGVYMAVLLLINSVKYVTLSFSILLARRLIATNHTLFLISKNAANYSQWFIYAALILGFVLQTGLFIRSFTQKEPYGNNAQRRKIIAKWRRRRRWAVTTAVCSLLAVLTLTVVNTYANREVELSPIEDAVLKDGNIYVSFDKVNDGSLHRFGYTTESGTVIRFIVIQKPNSSAYGVGLDACDICGETGYYEKDGQVVCNLCDVVMNINTIGFKGGCNPIVIDYSIENGNIVVPVDGLLEYESEFK